jgi:hypothetical protein
VHAEVSSVPTMLLLAASGACGTIVPGSAIAGAGGLRAYPLKPAIQRRAHVAYSSVTPLSIASEQVRAVLIETAVELVTSGRWPGASLLAPH